MDGDKRAAGGFQPARQGLSILNGGIIKRAYNFGQWQEGRIAERRRLGTLGLDRPELIARMKEFDTRRDAECDVRLMGKGNGAIQPRRWCESSLLVQDPFIWSKVRIKFVKSPLTDRTVPPACRQTAATAFGRWVD
jgi:hypothetical protein